MTNQPLSPPAHPVFGHLGAFSKDPLGFLTECGRNYGKVVPLRFLHQRAFLLTKPEDIERVFVADHGRFVKPDWLRTPSVRRLLGDSLVNSEGEEWRSQREASQPCFHARLLNGYGVLISESTERMLDTWAVGETRDIQRDMSRLTLSIIARTLLKVEAEGWTDEVAEAMDVLMARFAAKRNLFGMVPWPSSPTERRAAKRIDEAVDLLIEARLSDKKTSSQEAEFDLILLLQRLEGGHADRRKLREHVKTFLSAGFESSSLALSWTFLMLARDPEIRRRLSDELHAVLIGRVPSPADLPKLRYAKAVVKETLRLYSPLWMTGRQVKESYEVDGVSMPKGSLVMTSQWIMHRHPDYFYCPETFRPERWLEPEIDSLPHYAYFPFGGGPRVCIGQSFALMELTLILATIASRVHLLPIRGPEIKPMATMMLRPSSPILLQTWPAE